MAAHGDGGGSNPLRRSGEGTPLLLPTGGVLCKGPDAEQGLGTAAVDAKVDSAGHSAYRVGAPEQPGGSGPVHYPWWTSGDFDAFAGLTCDNLSAQLMLIFGLLQVFTPSIVFGRIWPGLAISVLCGNWYYSWQAGRLAKNLNRDDVTSQPYGINTPGAFPFLYTIIYGVYYDSIAKDKTQHDAMMLAWRVGAFATFVSGVLEMVAAPFGRRLRAALPTPALMAPLAGVGLVDLAFRGLVDIAKEPIPALMPLCIIVCGYFGEIKIGRIPVAIAAMAAGTAVAWAGGFKTADDVQDGADWLNDRWDFSGNSTSEVLAFPLAAVFTDAELWDDVLDYMGTIVPVALINFFCTLEALESAQEAGDNFDTTETLFMDGIGSCVGAIFGSVFGTTVYFGQPAYKRMGGRRGYTIAAGTVIGLLGFTGLIAPVYQCLSLGAVRCIIIFVGLTIAAQAVRVTPEHQYPSVLLGILPIVATFASPLVTPGSDNADGLVELGDGALLTSVCLTAVTFFAIDRRFKQAALSAGIASLLSLFGFMHSAAVSARLDKHKRQWHFCVGYGACAAWFVILAALQHRGFVLAERPPPPTAGA